MDGETPKQPPRWRLLILVPFVLALLVAVGYGLSWLYVLLHLA